MGFNGNKELRSAVSKVAASRSTSEGKESLFVMVREQEFSQKTDIVTPHASNKSVRRPLGLDFKRDTFAYIEVLRTEVRPNGEEVTLPIAIFNENHPSVILDSQVNVTGIDVGRAFTGALNATSGSIATYSNNFLIQQTNEVREEKFQLLETFGQNFIFFYGERPRFFDVTGILINANSHMWEREWWLNYETYLRGTRSVENQALVRLHVDNVAITGFILTANSSKLATQPRQVQFSFRMLITDYVFTDDTAPSNSVTFFADNLERKRRIANSEKIEKSGFDKVSDFVAGTIDKAKIALDNSITQLAISTISQGIFGNPFSAVTEGIAGAIKVADLLSDSGFGSLSQVKEFSEGIGSLVEFRGKPPELLRSQDGTGQTLRDIASDNLVASVDNSLNTLLSLSRSPVVQLISLLGTIIDSALLALGSTRTFGSARLKYLEFAERSNQGNLTGRFMGLDFTIPRGKINIVTVNPEQSGVVTTSSGILPATVQEKVNAGTFLSPQDFEFKSLSIPTGSGVNFEELKKDPNYFDLPRSWRLQIERNPKTMSEKIIASSRKNTESELILIIRKSKPESIKTFDTDLSKSLQKVLS